MNAVLLLIIVVMLPFALVGVGIVWSLVRAAVRLGLERLDADS